MRSNYLKYFFGLIVLDQITKVVFATRDFFFLGMHFHLVKNFGLSFGLNFGDVGNFLIITVVLILFAIYSFRYRHRVGIASAFVFAGALSNLADRLLFGYVRDFWDIGLGFTFNLADMFIIIGIITWIIADNSEDLVE